jgi:neutral ceramidase
MLKRSVIVVVIVAALVVAGGTFAVWSFRAYPVTTIAIERPASAVSAAPLQPASGPSVAATSEPVALWAGIAERDITPPIGIPKMGYSAWAREADGFRTRLKVRAFVLQSAGGKPLAVVQADLPASSLVLRHKVAEQVAARTGLGFGAISLHATHTHSGPGQYFESDFYNNFGSNQPGFDPDVFAFLVRQTSDAVIAAWDARRPAKVGIGQTTLYGATKNRSMGAYVRNDSVPDKRTDDAAALRAVNPLVTMVRIDAQDEDGVYRPWGAFSTFAIHGTGIPPFTAPYHGDVWAFFERDLEHRIREHYQPTRKPVHGPFEANHGDNNPNYVNGMRGDRETRRVGMAMARRAWSLFRSLDDQMRDDLLVRHAVRETDLLEPRTEDTAGLCERAIVGAATVGAAHGDEVFPVSYLPPFKAGWPKEEGGGCHAQKQWMLSWLQVWGVEPWRYPHRLLTAVIQVGDLVLAAVPFEVTFESGNRIEQAIRNRLRESGAEPRFVVVSSHANGYFAYSTTAEEYAAQFYEGGHTLYGPHTSDALARIASRLAADMVTSPGLEDLPRAWRFALATRQFSPIPETPAGQRQLLAEPVFRDAEGIDEPRWSFSWQDVSAGLMDIHEPLAFLETDNGRGEWVPLVVRGVPADDQGVDLQVRWLGAREAGMAGYELRWFNPPAGPGRYRFVIRQRGGLDTFHSPPFGSVTSR